VHLEWQDEVRRPGRACDLLQASHHVGRLDADDLRGETAAVDGREDLATDGVQRGELGAAACQRLAAGVERFTIAPPGAEDVEEESHGRDGRREKPEREDACGRQRRRALARCVQAPEPQ
jgi:hypothetical protein